MLLKHSLPAGPHGPVSKTSVPMGDRPVHPNTINSFSYPTHWHPMATMKIKSEIGRPPRTRLEKLRDDFWITGVKLQSGLKRGTP